MGNHETYSIENEWYTPKYIFDAMDTWFELDVAAAQDPNVTFVPAIDFYTANGLLQDWYGFVWCNPPWAGRGNKLPWVEKMGGAFQWDFINPRSIFRALVAGGRQISSRDTFCFQKNKVHSWTRQFIQLQSAWIGNDFVCLGSERYRRTPKRREEWAGDFITKIFKYFYMKAVKLTPKERELFEALKATPGGVLRQHIKPSSTICFRLLDAARNPLANYRYGLVHQLKDKNVLDVDKENQYFLHASSELKIG